MNYTPIQQTSIAINGNHFFVKRDDLLETAMGGNKARIAQVFLKDLKAKKCDCLIGYGNARSNMCRALALLSSAEKIPCHLVSPVDDDSGHVTTNSIIVSQCGAVIHKCRKKEVSLTIQTVFSSLYNQGFSPYYINGNAEGKGNEATPVSAYYNVFNEIKEQEKDLGVTFDFIFLATGTGMTQAGLLTGKAENNGDETIIGISVARDSEAAQSVIQQYCDAFTLENGFISVPKQSIIVSDDYLCGGYGKYNSGIEDTIHNLIKKEAIPTDPTYTGKAFYGMLEYVRSNEIKNSNILFIHTGGTPLFYDYLNHPTVDCSIRACHDSAELESVLLKVDQLLPTPLSKRVDLTQYSSKVIEHGHSLLAEVNGAVAGIALYYSNDYKQHKGYLTLLATTPYFRRCGIAKSLMKHVEYNLIRDGMEYLRLETEVNNTQAVTFYSSMGYCVIDKAKKLIMEKDLRV